VSVAPLLITLLFVSWLNPPKKYKLGWGWGQHYFVRVGDLL